MDPFHERLMVRAATIDELLSDAFEQLPCEKSHSELAVRRLAAWCRSSASGDWSLFARRLERDGQSLVDVLGKFATARPSVSVSAPRWVDDAVWISEALHGAANTVAEAVSPEADPCAFEDLLTPVVRDAEALLWPSVGARVRTSVGDGARACLLRSLLVELSNLAAPAIYERFAKVRRDAAVRGDVAEANSTILYDKFVSEMRVDGCRRLFEDKPVLLRLMASSHPPVDRDVARTDHTSRCRSACGSSRPATSRHQLLGDQDRRRPLRSAQLRPHCPDHRLRRRCAVGLQTQRSTRRRRLVGADREAEPKRSAPTEGRARAAARGLRLDRVHRSHELRGSARPSAIVPACRRLACPVPLLRRRRYRTRRTSSRRESTRCRSI